MRYARMCGSVHVDTCEVCEPWGASVCTRECLSEPTCAAGNRADEHPAPGTPTPLVAGQGVGPARAPLPPASSQFNLMLPTG